MSAIRVIPVPPLPRHIDPQVRAPQMMGLSAVAVLPCDTAPTRRLAVTLLRTEPGAETMPHHHGDFDTTLYVVRGTMAFHCGAGLRADVSVLAGEFCFIAPHAVHAEHNPDAHVDSLGITVRDTPGPFLFPCEAPGETRDAHSGIVVVPTPAVADPIVSREPGEPLSPLSAHHLRARRVALDRMVLAPGARFAPYSPTPGESALHILSGAARLRDGTDAAALYGESGAWWYIEPSTKWSVENAAVEPAVLLLIRGAPPGE